MTQIMSVRSSFPAVPELAGRDHQADHRAPPSQAPSRRAVLERLHSQRRRRHQAHRAAAVASTVTSAASVNVNDRYIAEATVLGELALRAALARPGLPPALDLLIVTSVTGVAVPSLDARLIPRLGLRPDLKRLPSSGLAASREPPALARLHDYLLAWPGQHRGAARGRALLAELAAGARSRSPTSWSAPSSATARPRSLAGGRRRPGRGVPRSSPRAARCTPTAATRSAGGSARTASASC